MCRFLCLKDIVKNSMKLSNVKSEQGKGDTWFMGYALILLNLKMLIDASKSG